MAVDTYTAIRAVGAFSWLRGYIKGMLGSKSIHEADAEAMLETIKVVEDKTVSEINGGQ